MNQQQYSRLGQYRDDDATSEDLDTNVLDNIVDLKQINARLQDWFAKIKTKQSGSGSKKEFDKFAAEIHSSVFTPVILATLSDDALSTTKSMTPAQFDRVIDSVRDAISTGVHPRLVTKGSSGSYFALNRQHKVVGIFKPKNEEPYGQLNPKWTKWLHRNIFPCFFGRSCLIPNLSYISEAAACLLDRQLRTNIVPPTDVVWLTSTSFNYDYFDRRAYANKGKPLPAKQGSFQVFLEGFKDATEFLREHPWPDTAPLKPHDTQKRAWSSCVGSSDIDNNAMEEFQNEITSVNPGQAQFWTESLMQGMREELEKLVILDYIMRNTDRGLDNWMLKVTPASAATGKDKVELIASHQNLSLDVVDRPPSRSSMSQSNVSTDEQPGISLGAIDNSLAFPWKHPDEWRSFPFGWLFLPASLIGQPFSAKTRQHFLPLLSDPAWWRETTSSLKSLFSQDADFQEKMFAKQMAVLKGQAWNVLETLKSGDQGPLELARRPRLHVWTDIMEVPVTASTKKINIHPKPGKSLEPIFYETEEEVDLGVAAGSHGIGPNSLPTLSERIVEGPVDTLHTDESAALQQHELYAQNEHRFSFDERRVTKAMPNRSAKQRARGMSLGMRGTRFGGGQEESDLGDLGYALMHDEETSTRRVVVERLETVHGAEAVFSWC